VTLVTPLTGPARCSRQSHASFPARAIVRPELAGLTRPFSSSFRPPVSHSVVDGLMTRIDDAMKAKISMLLKRMASIHQAILRQCRVCANLFPCITYYHQSIKNTRLFASHPGNACRFLFSDFIIQTSWSPPSVTLILVSFQFPTPVLALLIR